MESRFSAIPHKRPLAVKDAIVYQSDLGPWKTKSNGVMDVMFAFDREILRRMWEVDPYELELAPEVELGIRTFHTAGLAAGTAGGQHFHRIKQEIICAPKGSVEFILRDVYGGERRLILKKGSRGLYVPPFVMHDYTVLEDAELIGVSNTLYNHDNPKTHDTYAEEPFQLLLKHYA